ncbi:uncharacterized protein SCHCODRAFT_02633470 [Schizophyllum commune H4-8]|uniref:Expressed protein n=1 Tax=Schizophyllum commune (strain H4-8 / FGSC 9210) TaxID=578458 RepID=D8QB85_SCHCM|nr:uncharacterized protein SCHCODRAFT_02633470 [Schizophyllum commune H4-8]KAI5889072.1 hypothetical protein SCHCODRAFT_02633470 [Schizophyllum commune H4-8]
MHAAQPECANSRACKLCDSPVSTDTLRISLTTPHSPNLPYSVTRPLLPTALAPAIRHQEVLPTIIA